MGIMEGIKTHFSTTNKTEFKFTCNRCGKVWYATKKEITEMNKTKNEMKYAQAHYDMGMIHSGNSVRDHKAKMAQMKMGYRDYKQCQECGSKNVNMEIAE